MSNDKMQVSTLAMLTTACGQGKEPEVRRALQAVIEGAPLGESSLDSKIVATFGGMSFTEANFRETIVYNNQHLKRHRNGGGWVPAEQDEYDESKPFVAETAYVGPFVMVSGNARVSSNAWLSGNARVSGNAQMSGNAWLFGDEHLESGSYYTRQQVELALSRQ